MKTKSLLTFVLCLILSIFYSCDKDYLNPNGIEGVWIWVKSEGGFADITLTPASEGITKHIIIDDLYFTEYVNDSIVFKSQYELITKPGNFYGTYFDFGQGVEEPYKISKKELMLFDQCDDCFSHTYKRK